jgi:hypothetical protein
MKTSNNIFHKLLSIFSLLTFCFYSSLFALVNNSIIVDAGAEGSFKLASAGKTASLYVSTEDFSGVIYAVKDLQKDLSLVTGTEPLILSELSSDISELVIIGTLGNSKIIDDLISKNIIDPSSLKGKWETFQIQSVKNPIKGIENALIIVGSDKRGTIYGIYELSQQIGVSPWYWWADVPVKKSTELFIKPGIYSLGEPAVKYRGIFINDEAPALSGWSQEKFGGFNHLFYENVFELILRLKGNYLWPAMWGSAFYDDDSLNAILADEYGIVIGTSHHEPLMRAHDEWRRYGSGTWNFEKNPEKLREFWADGISRMGNKESIVTVGMRGDGDEPMTEGTAIALLEEIVKTQRQIIAEVTGKRPEEIPQDWALYKEVQDYYDNGMRVPEDITLLLCDDNWGNVRRLPRPEDPERAGGYGMYYHFDFVGGPRNYKWVNTNPIARIWEQMNLSFEHGVNRIWIVNVGDIKPMEYPIQFFLDFAWNPKAWPADQLSEYARKWSEEQFGPAYSAQIADFMTRYLMYNSRKKPEMLSPQTYSLINYREAERVTKEYLDLSAEAKVIGDKLPMEYRDAYFQLVQHPIDACSNLNNLYYNTAKNYLYAEQGRTSTNEIAKTVSYLFQRDEEITMHYNQVMANGKWNHMMDQTHIGYTSWQQPDKNSMPEVKSIQVPKKALMGIMIEGYSKSWPENENEAVLPPFDSFNKQEYYFEIFNKGKTPFNYNITTDHSWVRISNPKGKVELDQRVNIGIDWQTIPAGQQQAIIKIKGPQSQIINIKVVVNNVISEIEIPELAFIENNGIISINAEHYSKAIESDKAIKWQVIPTLGRTLSGVTSLPSTHPLITPKNTSPRLEYSVYLFKEGKVNVNVYISPSLNFYNDEGLKYGISIDNEPIRVVNIHENDTVADWKYPQVWNQSVADNIRILTTEHNLIKPGAHIVKLWLITPGVVFQKIVIDAGGLKSSYLGPEESIRWSAVD